MRLFRWFCSYLLDTHYPRKPEAGSSSWKSYFFLLSCPFTQAQLSPLASHPGEVHRVGALTQADGWFARPAAICFAGAMLGATLEGEALLAGVDKCVAHGGQVQGPDVGMRWRLWLFAVVGWIRGKTLLDLRRVRSPEGPSIILIPR